MNDDTPEAGSDRTEGMASGAAGKNPASSERAAKLLDAQIALAQARSEHIKAQQGELAIQSQRDRERTARDATLHGLRTEKLALQSQALRSRHARQRSQRLHDRLRSVYQSVLSLLALVVLALIVYAVYDAATDQSVVVSSFQVPPSFAQAGNNGTVVASDFLDRLQSLQAATQSSHSARTLSDAWSNDVQLQIPEAGVSLGDVRRTLHAWLGHETRISGDVVQNGDQIALTLRGTGFAARTFSGNADDLSKLLTAAAEYVYGQAEPYLFANYLVRHGRDAEAIALIKAAFPAASSQDQPWLLLGWGHALGDLNQYAAAAQKNEQAIHLDPHFWLGYNNLSAIQSATGQEEAAYQTGIRLEKIARRGSWFAADVPEDDYEPVDYLRMDLPAAHQDIVNNEAAHGGVGTMSGADAPVDAEMLARMHAHRQATSIVQASPGASSDPYALAETAFLQGLRALDQQNYAQAASHFQTANTLLVQNPTMRNYFNSVPACYLGLALELAGQPDQADAAITRGGHFVDCYRFKADIADHRGDWPQAQRDYAAAVALAPSLPMAYDSWGLALMRHHDYAGAIVKFEQANKRGPHWCDPLKHWGDALGRARQLQRRRAEIRASREVHAALGRAGTALGTGAGQTRVAS